MKKCNDQLIKLSEISDLCHSLNINLWLRGGWAIDFLIGRISRAHEDIDLVIWARDKMILEKELDKMGFMRNAVSERQTDFSKDGVDVQFLYLTQVENGTIFPLGLPQWVWRADAMPTKLFHLNDISLYVLHPNQLLEEKHVYQQIGRKPRTKDIESINLLRAIIDSTFYD
ncbi:nucleotidyltransferase domain-containing protein [Falsibacillus albus]|nr:hypothetical protein [Falsibacillus albus]